MRVILKERYHPSRGIATVRPFHLEHIRTIISEELGTIRPSDMMSKVEHPNIR